MVLDHYKQLTQVGAYIDQNSTASVTSIALDYQDTQLLPGVSARTRLISFREEKPYNPHNRSLDLNEINERIDASNAIQLFDHSITNGNLCNALKKFKVKYVIADNSNQDLFVASVLKCGGAINVVYNTDDLVLLEAGGTN